MSAFPKVAPPELPGTHRLAPSKAYKRDSPIDASLGDPKGESGLKRELKAITLLLFGLFLATALAAGLKAPTASADRTHCLRPEAAEPFA